MEKIFILIGIILFLFFLLWVLRSNKPIKNACLSMVGGVSSLLALSFFGINIAVNVVTVLISLCLGFPGVLLMILNIYVI